MKKETKVLPDIQWHTKFKSYVNYTGTDVSVSINKGYKGKQQYKRINFTFRNNIWKNFDTEFVVFAAMKNRIYFRSTSNIEGYKLTTGKTTSAYLTATLNENETEIYEPFVGSYSLRFDKYYELYYIDIEQEGIII